MIVASESWKVNALPILSVREEHVGGELSGAVHIEGPDGNYSPQGRARLIILVHGFNVTYDHAISYSWKIAVARDAGRLLANYLGKFTGPQGMPLEILFVAHSLGNRVVLECIDAMAASSPHIMVRATCSMAAAVPVDQVGGGGRLRRASLAPGKRMTLHSRNDDVLHYAFPPGEFADGEGWALAVGRYGDPISNWTEHHDLTGAIANGYGHGDYWSGTQSGDLVAQFLNLLVPRAVNTKVLAERDLPAARSLDERRIDARIMGTRRIGFGA